MSIHNIFGDASPGTFTVYNDGQETTVGHVFQIAATDTTPWEVAGARVYISPQTPKGVTAIVGLSLDANVANPIREVEFTTPQTVGWHEIPWEPYVPAKGSPHTVSLRFPGRLDYLAAPSPSNDPLASPTLPALTIYGVGGSPSRSLFRYGTSSGGNSPSGPLWGLDVIVTDGEPLEEEPPANVVPVVEAGSNRSIYLGQSATLTAVGSDTDGTIASYEWWQVSGPSANLTGSGAARTFTPTVVGTYVFAVTATDDDADTSPVDTVTVTVLAVPQTDAPLSVSGKFGMIEVAVRELILRIDEDATSDNVDNSPSYDAATQDVFYWISLIPGGSTTRTGGEWVVDIDVLAKNYSEAMSKALDLEAPLLRGRHRTSVMLLDSVFQNEGPAERPWEDDGVYRIGSTYVFTARRPG